MRLLQSAMQRVALRSYFAFGKNSELSAGRLVVYQVASADVVLRACGISCKHLYETMNLVGDRNQRWMLTRQWGNKTTSVSTNIT